MCCIDQSILMIGLYHGFCLFLWWVSCYILPTLFINTVVCGMTFLSTAIILRIFFFYLPTAAIHVWRVQLFIILFVSLAQDQWQIPGPAIDIRERSLTDPGAEHVEGATESVKIALFLSFMIFEANFSCNFVNNKFEYLLRWLVAYTKNIFFMFFYCYIVLSKLHTLTATKPSERLEPATNTSRHYQRNS